jgi:predicted TPR repeat methyltransferase
MKDEYEELAKSYDKQLKDKLTSDMYKEWREELKIAIKKYDVKTGTLMDLGCGTGITTIPWIKKFKRVIGVELSKPMLKEAIKKSSQVKWINQDITKLRIKEKADAIICHFDVLNHILKKGDLRKTFNVVYEILNKGGIFIFDMMSPESFVWLERKGKLNKISERSYSKEEVKEMLTNSGFNILNIKKQKTLEWDKKPRRNLFLVQKS